MATDKEIEAAARAIREEIVRQYRDDDRRKCSTGIPFWEEEVQPMLIAEAALTAAEQVRASEREALDKIARQSLIVEMDEDQKKNADYEGAYDAMIVIARNALKP